MKRVDQDAPCPEGKSEGRQGSDEAIRHLMEGGRMEPVPLGLRRRVAFRVGLLAMARSEHRSARYLSALGLLLALAVAVGFRTLAGVGGLDSSWFALNMPGCMGYFDYLVGQSADTLGATVFVGTIAAGGLWAFVQRRARPL